MAWTWLHYLGLTGSVVLFFVSLVVAEALALVSIFVFHSAEGAVTSILAFSIPWGLVFASEEIRIRKEYED